MNSRATLGKLTVLATLYLSQGLPYGFFTQALPVLMRQAGHSLEQIGFAALLALPWALKFLWAPVLDRNGSHSFGLRRSWIIPLQCAMAMVLAIAAAFEPRQQFMGVFALVLLVNALSATQDIAADGLAVDMLDRQERGLGNGIQVAAYRLGMVLGGGVLLMSFSHLGWRMSFLLMAALVMTATIPVWLHREGTVTANRPAHSSDMHAHFLRLPGVWRILVMLFLFKFGDTLATTMLRPFMVDHGLTMNEVGWMLGTIGFIAGLLGALAGGWLAGHLQRKIALITCAAIQAASLGVYVTMAGAFPDKSTLAWLIAIEHAGGGMATATLFTCMMDWCRRGHSGTDYTVQASTVVIASTFAASVSGIVAQHFGYVTHFGLAFALGLIALAAVVILFPRSEANLRQCPVARPDRPARQIL